MAWQLTMVGRRFRPTPGYSINSRFPGIGQDIASAVVEIFLFFVWFLHKPVGSGDRAVCRPPRPSERDSAENCNVSWR